MRHFLLLACLCIAPACSDDRGLGTNPGSGTQTLLVEASAHFKSHDNASEFSVDVKKAGVPVAGAVVRISSDLGDAVMVAKDVGKYEGAQVGWAAKGYALDVTVADADGKITDELQASLSAPVAIVMRSPDLTQAFDPHTLQGGVLDLSWQGPPASSIRIKTKDFEPATFTPDPLKVSIPATVFKESTQKLEMDRSNTVNLAGGLPGSKFSARYELEATFIVLNPY